MRGTQSSRPRLKKGFTLAELLIVIAIIAVLAALLFPVLSRVKRKAQGVFCLNNLKQLGFSWASYSHDNEDKIPPNNGDKQAGYVPGASPGYPQTWCAGWLNNSVPVPDNTNTLYLTASHLWPYHKIWRCGVVRLTSRRQNSVVAIIRECGACR